MRVTRTAGAALVGMIAGVGVAIAGVYPAGAADIVTYRDFQQTLPASVIASLDWDVDEETKVTSNTRVGVVGDRDVVPLKSVPGPRWGIIGGALSTVLYIDGKLRVPTEFDRNGPKPEWIDQAEWDACAPSGGDDWSGNFFDGLRDWQASLGGTSCDDVRAGWEVDKDDDYVPIGQVGGPAGYPTSRTHSIGKGTVTLHPPVWSSHFTDRIDDAPTRVEGWVVPIEVDETAGYTSTNQFGVDWLNMDGTVFLSANAQSLSMSPGIPEQIRLRAELPACAAAVVTYCLPLGSLSPGTIYPPRDAVNLPVMASLRLWTMNGSQTMAPLPYVNPLDGSVPAAGELARQQLLTAVTTASGNVYQCRTVSFVETAPTIPRPCEPDVPEWEEIVKRIVEVVPETDPGYVPGSDPTRGVQTTEVPAPVRDWQADRQPDEDSRIDLRKVGVGSCFDYPEQCLDWFEDQDKAAKYECLDGSRAVSLDECLKYARLFKLGALTSGWAYPQPGAQPGAQPGGQTSPGGAPALSPGTQPSDPATSRQCWPTGWGLFNPFEWVYRPVKCVLEWAFVPRQSAIQNTMNAIRDRWNQTSARQIAAMLLVVTSVVPAEGGCGGIPLNVTLPGGVEVHETLLNSCSGPLAPAAAVTKSVLTGSIIVASVLACSRYLAMIFGFVGYGNAVEQRAAAAEARKAGKGNVQ